MPEPLYTVSESPSKRSIGPHLKLCEPLASQSSRINCPKAVVDNAKSKGKHRGAGTRSTGKLAKFLTMPLDVIFEIVCQLQPLDLLQLSRVSKDFAKTFGSKSSKALWKAVRKNVNEIPEPPDHVSELRYASILFERNCLRRWTLAKGVLRTHDTILRGMLEDERKERVECAPVRPYPHRLRLFLLTAAERSAWIREDILRLPVVGRTDYYYVPELNAVVERSNSLSPQDYDKFVEARKKFVHESYMVAKSVHDWERRVAAEKRDVARTRQDTIEARLIEMGYTREDFPSVWDRAWNSLVNQPRPVTARIWKKIEPQLIKAIEDRKALFIASAKQDLRNRRIKELWLRYQVYVATLPQDEGPLPPCNLLALVEPVKALLDREDDGLAIPAADMDAVITEATGQYCAEARRTLVTLLRAERAVTSTDSASSEAISEMVEKLDGRDDDDDDDELRWASSFFQCCFCDTGSDPQTYPDLVQHMRSDHLQTSVPPWRPYLSLFRLPECDTTVLYPQIHASATQKAIKALEIMDLPVDASLAQADESLERLREKVKMRTDPASFAKAIKENIHLGAFAAW